MDDFNIAFYAVIYDCIDNNVPHSALSGSRRNIERIYSRFVRRIETKKCHVWSLYEQFIKQSYYTKYKIISSKCRQAKLDATRKFEESIITSGNLGKFFRYAISRLTTKHNVGPLRLPDGSITVDPAVKATLLSQYFDSVYTVDNGDRPTTSIKATIGPALFSILLLTPLLYSKHSKIST